MKRMVDGVAVELTSKEEEEILAEWAANDAREKVVAPTVVQKLDGLIAELQSKGVISAK